MRSSLLYVAAGAAALALSLPLVAQKATKPQKPKLAFMDENAVAYIRPGVKVKIVSASIAKDGTITTRATLIDPKGLPLDRDGITTAGPVNLRFMGEDIPSGQTQYILYTHPLLKGTPEHNPPQTHA